MSTDISGRRVLVGAVVLLVFSASTRLAARQSISPRRSTTDALGTAAAPLVLQGVTVVDVTSGRLLPERTVVVVGNRVRAVGPARSTSLPASALVVDARGKYLIPGLWDMHVHFRPPHTAPEIYSRFIANGVTGIRNPGSWSSLDTLRQWQREIAAGQRVGPRMIISGPSFMGYYQGQLNTVAEARRLVDSLKAAGADLLKLRTVSRELYFAMAAEARRVQLPWEGHVLDGGIVADSSFGLFGTTASTGKPADTLLGGSAVWDGRSQVTGLTVTAPPMTIVEASDSGARIIDHAAVIDVTVVQVSSMRSSNVQRLLPGLCPDDGRGSANVESCWPIAARLARNGTWIVPTFAAHMSSIIPGFYKRGRPAPSALANFARLDSVPAWLRLDVVERAGIPLLAGTDVNGGPEVFAPGSSLHEELAIYVWGGMSPLGALRAATLNAAKALDATDSLGTIAPGKMADLVLLDANPLAEIRNTTAIRAVVANGRYFDRSALDAMLVGAGRPE